MEKINPDIFKQEIQQISEEVGVKIKEIHLRKMTQKWASCSSKGRLTFDPGLLLRLKEERLKTVLHEILHLRYPNHGKMFRRMLSNYLNKLKNEI